MTHIYGEFRHRNTSMAAGLFLVSLLLGALVNDCASPVTKLTNSVTLKVFKMDK